MATGALDRRSEIIESVATRIHSRLDPADAEAPERFARQFLANVAARDMESLSTDDLYGASLSVWRLGAERKPKEIRVRVYNPHVDEHGWHSRHTIVEVVIDDMRFLFDSVIAYLNGHEAEVHLAIHPIVEVQRADDGTIQDLKTSIEGHPDAHREAFMHIQVTEQPEDRHEELRLGILRVLTDVRAAVEDFVPMRDRCQELVGGFHDKSADAAEANAFLAWLIDDHFNFVGYRLYEFDTHRARVREGSGLGVLRDEFASVYDGLLTGGQRPAELDRPDLVRITKTNQASTVHRPVPMDGIGVKATDADGKVVGEHLFIGLFTSRAYTHTPEEIPILRRKVALVKEQAGFHVDSYDARSLTHILDTYPRDELFQISVDDLREIALGINYLQERRQIAFFPRVDPFQRFVSCLVFMPRDHYDTGTRTRVQEILEEALDGKTSAFYTRITDAAHARLHYIVDANNGMVPPFDAALIEKRIVEAGRGWNDRLEAALIEAYDEKTAVRALHRFAAAFPSSYRDHFTEAVAVSDIACIEEALTTGDVGLNLYQPIESSGHAVNFKLYAVGEETPLSSVLPMLENMGFDVLREVPYAVRPADLAEPVWIRDFALEAKDGLAIDVPDIRVRFHEAFHGVWRGELENDGFNELVLRSHLTAREVSVIRTYCKFLLQAGAPFSQRYMEETLARNADTAHLLVSLFLARFDPARDNKGDAVVELTAKIEQALEKIPNLDEDRILRAFLIVIQTTLRTNYFQKDADGQAKPYLAIKLDSKHIDALPKPLPHCEIFVCSPRVEAVHLRGGPVARGGIRWSDRREDFRTEVLGLMKAQQVKNAVIVPVGSKGGFVVKQPPAERAALQDEVVFCYQTLMSGLLDLTDNLVGDGLVSPVDVVRHDDDDPYLVVAADKGTATFSDIANEMSVQYGFWLGDAFASGGSAGYDHKKMGITAKGAWESVKRHFREMGKDIQSEDFTVVGVGDMAGDVFGNGMLLSHHIRLLGAFNHMHIFIDPDPKTAESFAERQRLFDLPGSTWDDYDRALISKGGGVWSRSEKRIPVSDAMRERFRLTAEHVTPNELIVALLRTETELLWLGGIGTYVRASSEVDTQVGDRTNDAVRIDAREVGARVIGEGANLGLTQRARVEYALLGGRMNTDAIDNSAGVDCSDHEVNIKILLGEAERDGDLTRKQRNALLEAMTDEVAALVLRDNYLQTQSITVTQELGVHLLDRLGRLMRGLEHDGQLDRTLEFLPSDDELIERIARGVSLTRPELSILLAYTKMKLYDELLASDVPDDPFLAEKLIRYFPTQLREQYPERIRQHRLRREIVATALTNEIVNRVGVTFPLEVQETTGLPPKDIARAYVISRTVFDLPPLWLEIESLDNLAPAPVQAAMLAECGRLVERGAIWFLRHGERPLDIAREIEQHADGVKQILDALDDMLDVDQRERVQARAIEFEEAGAPAQLAHRAALLRHLTPTCDIVKLARERSRPVLQVARTYLAVGSRFGFLWLRRVTANLPSDTAWDKLAVTSLQEDLDAHQIALTDRVLAGPQGDEEPDVAIEGWVATRKALVKRTDQLLAELQAHAAVDLAMLAVANRQLKAVIG